MLKVDRTLLGGTGLSEAHARPFLDQIDKALADLGGITKHQGDIDLLGKLKLVNLLAQLRQLKSAASLEHLRMRARGMAMSGDLELHLPGGLAENVSASDLNAAAAGTFKRSFAVILRTAGKEPHLWASFGPVLTPAEAVVVGAVGVPTVPSSLKLDMGRLLVEMTFDTDGGSTKIYAPSTDSVSCQVQTKADDTLLGWPVAAVTKTFDVV